MRGKNYKGLTQWEFVPLASTLISTTDFFSKPWQKKTDESLLKSFRPTTKKLQRINLMKLCDPKADTCLHKWKITYLHQKKNMMSLGRMTWIKKIMIWIWLTENLITHPRKSFIINELWSSKWNEHKSEINKIRLDRRTWRRFLIKTSNKLRQKYLKTEPPSPPQPSTNLQGKQIYMYDLDTVHRQFATHSRGIFRINERWSD